MINLSCNNFEHSIMAKIRKYINLYVCIRQLYIKDDIYIEE